MSPLDLHVLGTPPAFVLSQDQTLMFNPLPFHPRQRTIWRFALQNLTVICHSSLYRFQGSRPSCQSLARACLSLDGLISIPKKSHFVKPFSNKVTSYFNPLHIALLLSFFLPNIRFYSVTSLRKYPFTSAPPGSTITEAEHGTGGNFDEMRMSRMRHVYGPVGGA